MDFATNLEMFGKILQNLHAHDTRDRDRIKKAHMAGEIFGLGPKIDSQDCSGRLAFYGDGQSFFQRKELNAASDERRVDRYALPAAKITSPSACPKPFSTKLIYGESYFGFVEDEMDSLILVEAVVAKKIAPFAGGPLEIARLSVRSGSVFILAESCRYLKRWKDGLQWSPSRSYGQFLLYRQVGKMDRSCDAEESAVHAEALNIPGVDPRYAQSSLKDGTQIVKNGLTKRSITVTGSDGSIYRVISYYNRNDVLDAAGLVLRRPADDPEVNQVMANHVFRGQVKRFRESGSIHRRRRRKTAVVLLAQ
ncbi:hypothetical protein HDU84_004281 [Entophlyctis sp. JEL0112]|nr:hypothetical protein HDU84_004281 [Entophlyctis sp. JEL0112]